MLKLFKYVFVVVVSSGCLLAMFVAILFLWPTLVINPSTLEWLKQNQVITGVDWQALNISHRRKTIWQRWVAIRADRLSLKMAGITLDVKALESGFLLDLNPSNPGLLAIEPLKATVIEAEYQLSDKTHRAESKATGSLSWLSLLHRLRIADLDIPLERITLRGHGFQTITGSGRLSVSNWQLADPKSQLRIRLNAEQDPRWDGELTIKLSPDSRSGQARLMIDGKFSSGEQQLAIELDSRLAERSSQGILTLSMTAPSLGLQGLTLNACSQSLAWGDSLDQDVTLKLHCLEGAGRPQRSTANVLAKFLPELVNFSLLSQVRIEGPLDEKVLHMDHQLKLHRNSQAAVQFFGTTHMQATTPLRKFKLLDWSLDSDVAMAVEKYAALVEILSTTHWPIPAPFNQLSGSGQCRLIAHVTALGDELTAPLSCRVDLQGRQQKIVLDADAEWRWRPQLAEVKPKVSADIRVDGLEFRLPSLQPSKGLPQLRPDQRFKNTSITERPLQSKRTEHMQSPTLPFDYELTIRSRARNSILIFNDLTKEPIPLNVDLRMASHEGMSGKVAIDDFSFDFIKRKLIIEHLAIQWEKGQSVAALDGKVDLSMTDYDVELQIFGSLEKPQYRLQSDPPMTQSDLYAVLLFGRKPDALDRDHLRSVDQARAAIADGAVSLVSMYYLAATPIESIGYNPATGLFAAKIQLEPGLSLSLGSDTESLSRVGLRKRLGGGWVVDTSVGQDQDGQGRQGIAMLKWGRRY